MRRRKNREEDARIPVFEALLPCLCPLGSWGLNLLLILLRASLSFFLLQALECLFKAPSVKSFVKKLVRMYM